MNWFDSFHTMKMGDQHVIVPLNYYSGIVLEQMVRSSINVLDAPANALQNYVTQALSILLP